MPSGEEEDVAERGRLSVFFIAPAARAFLAFFTILYSHSESTLAGRQDHWRAPAGSDRQHLHLVRCSCGFVQTQKPRHEQALIDRTFFCGETTIYSGPGRESFLLVPVIPKCSARV